ncbi:D-lactate ferricytochrome c oxidoreductase [Emydomyces testavorans]|uniref:D-lactate dehydrogenase (cytochrome) n=1 Tax=Emydomyces testavorans TaxID=2070801 RepID=A0AAF0II24_9EURO|nr:D-lactate ferricytochrome c oxidoreductase [Emydomyces testavorans]
MRPFSRAAARFLQRGVNSRFRQQGPTVQKICREWRSSSTVAHDGAQHSTSTSWKTGQILMAVAAAVGSGYAFGMYQSRPRVAETVNEPRYATVKEMEKAISELKELLGEDVISTDDEDLHLHGYSEWSSINVDQLPVAVVYPKSTEEVSKIAKVCHKYRLPMIPYSGGSSLEGHFSAPHGGMSIDFMHMNKILEFHDDDLDVVVQPSVQWMHLNEEIRDTGLFFPIDPGPSAKIGGMVGTNCSGTNAVRYGTMKDWVLNLTVVLADGRVIKTRRRPRKSSAGYNLTGMFVGSEGTLGIVTEITLKLAVLPEETRVGVATFDTVREAANAAMRVIRRGIPIQCVEILDEVQMGVINKAGGTNRTWKETPTLFFKFSGTKSGVLESMNVTKDIAKENGSTSFEFAKNDREGHDLWSARKQCFWSMLALRKDGSNDVWSTDVAVPLSRLPDIIELSKKDLDDLGMFASILGHVGDGNFHESIMYDKQNNEQCEKVKKVVYDMVDRAIEMEGSCTGEHGVGMGKKSSLVKELGPDTIDVMRSVKRALDPHWLLNPGKIFDVKKK